MFLSLIIFLVINIYISEPEPEPYIIDLIPDNISIPTPEWKNIDQNKVIQIVGGILGILSFGCLVKFLSDKVITSKSIKFTDWFMTGSQYHMESKGNWSIGCPSGDAVISISISRGAVSRPISASGQRRLTGFLGTGLRPVC